MSRAGICGRKGKTQYSKSDAVRAMAELKAEHDRVGDRLGAAQLNVYRCTLCTRYHVGHDPRRSLDA